MAWDFCTDPDVQARLDWADRFVAEEIEPVESLLYDVVDVGRPEGSIAELFEQWRREVKEQQLYAVHLPPEQGGQGFGEGLDRAFQDWLARLQTQRAAGDRSPGEPLPQRPGV